MRQRPPGLGSTWPSRSAFSLMEVLPFPSTTVTSITKWSSSRGKPRLSCRSALNKRFARQMTELENRMSNRFEEMTALLKELAGKDAASTRKPLPRQPTVRQVRRSDSDEHLEQSNAENQPLMQHSQSSAYLQRPAPISHYPISRASSATSGVFPAKNSRLSCSRTKLRSARSMTMETARESPKEYSELTGTFDYEELKSPHISTDEEGSREACVVPVPTAISLSVMSGPLSRARSLQMDEAQRSGTMATLRQTHSDSKEDSSEELRWEAGSFCRKSTHSSSQV